jgi:signal transduction histidine kinase
MQDRSFVQKRANFGMWVSKHIAEKMQGKLEVRSSTNLGGTSYILTLPIQIKFNQSPIKE